jgi:Na+/H+ antiporter NhaC
MNEIFIIAGDYLKGKSVYPAFRRLLNLLLNISIASFVYEACYGKYTWLNYNDYKEILDFFIKGNFFIPFSIFLVVYSLTQFTSIVFFSALNHFKTIKITREIIQYQFKKEAIDERLKEINKVSKYVSPVRLTKNTMLGVYQELRNHITPEAFDEIEKGLKEPKQNLEANFTLAFRMLIAITIYFFSLPQFGWVLYLTAMIVLIIGMYVLMISYRFLDIIPTLMRKFHHQAEEYLKLHTEKTNANTEQK